MASVQEGLGKKSWLNSSSQVDTCWFLLRLPLRLFWRSSLLAHTSGINSLPKFKHRVQTQDHLTDAKLWHFFLDSSPYNALTLTAWFSRSVSHAHTHTPTHPNTSPWMCFFAICFSRFSLKSESAECHGGEEKENVFPLHTNGGGLADAFFFFFFWSTFDLAFPLLLPPSLPSTTRFDIWFQPMRNRFVWLIFSVMPLILFSFVSSCSPSALVPHPPLASSVPRVGSFPVGIHDLISKTHFLPASRISVDISTLKKFENKKGDLCQQNNFSVV